MSAKPEVNDDRLARDESAVQQLKAHRVTVYSPRDVPRREHGLLRQLITDVRAKRLTEWFDVTNVGVALNIAAKPGTGDPRWWIGVALRFWAGMFMNLNAFTADDREAPYEGRGYVPVLQGVNGWSKNKPYHLGAPLRVMSNFLAWLDTFIVAPPSPIATLLENQNMSIEDALMQWVVRSRGAEARTIDVQNWIGALLGHSLDRRERTKLSRALENLVKAGILSRNAAHGQRFIVKPL